VSWGWAILFTLGRFPVSKVRYGLIVEGQSDQEVVPELVRKVVPSAVIVQTLALGGKSKLKNLAGYLNHFQYVVGGGPVDKVLVIEDCDQRLLESVEADLAQRVPEWASCFPPGVQVCGVRQAIESWLMVDADVINAVAKARGARGNEVGEVKGEVEEIKHPKQEFLRLLSQAESRIHSSRLR
jgi:hypothetical protein